MSLSLLIIDPDDDSSYLLIEYLNVLFEDMDTVLSFDNAKSKLNSNSYDAIILDVNMDEPESLELIAIAKTFVSLLVVVSTGSNQFTDNECVKIAKEKGADLFYLKPFSENDLLNGIHPYFTCQKN